MTLKDYIPNRSGSTDCMSCAGVGFDLIVGPTMSKFSLCNCISESCPCGGRAPWLVYEPTKRTMVSCACNDVQGAVAQEKFQKVSANTYEHRYMPFLAESGLKSS